MDPETPDSPQEQRDEEAHRRLALPLLIPAVAFLFSVLLIYGLSRIYLDLQDFAVGDVNMATPLALAVALGILGVAWYLAANPRIPRWQIASITGAAVVLLVGGTIWAAVHEEEIEAGPGVEGPTATPPPGGAIQLVIGDNFFELNGQREPIVQVPVGREVAISLVNDGAATHNMHVDGSDGTYLVDFCESGGEEFCSDPDQIEGGQSATITVQFDETGSFLFRCDFHPTEMTGTIEAAEGVEPPPPPGGGPGPGASPGPTEAGGGAGLEMTMGDNFFEFRGEEEPAIEAALGQEVTVDLVNEGFAVHNMHIAGTDNDYGAALCEAGGEEPCSDPDQMAGGETGTITFQFDAAGTFEFRCDFHPTEMLGTIEVR